MRGALRARKSSANASGFRTICTGFSFESAKVLFDHVSTFEIRSKTKNLNVQTLDDLKNLQDSTKDSECFRNTFQLFSCTGDYFMPT